MSAHDHTCVLCGRQFPTSIAKRRHELKCKDNPDGVGYRCPICGAILANSQSFHNHKNACQRRQDENFEKIKRKREHHINDLLHSQQLEQVLQDQGVSSSASKKRKINHSSATVSSQQQPSPDCHTCGDEHNHEHSSSTDTYKCHLCNKTFRSKKLFFKHRQVHYKRREEGFVCKSCDKVFKTARELRSHVKNSHNNINTDDASQTLQCSECEETFNTWLALYKHRFTHRNNESTRFPIRSLPFERDPENNRAPWVSMDDEGNQVIDERFRSVYTVNRNTIHAWHDHGRVRGVYNYPVDSLSMDPEQLRPFLEEIYHLEKMAFKVNISFGVILQNIETSEMRYFTPYYNNTILDLPFRIDSARDITNLLNDIGNGEMLEKIMIGIGESSKWQAVYVTNVSFFVYRTHYRFGGGGVRGSKRRLSALPQHIVNKHSIKCLFTHTTRINGRVCRTPYSDNLCVFRCMSVALNGEVRLEKKVKEYYALWVTHNEIDDLIIDPDPQMYTGMSLDELPNFEECFKMKINVFSLDPDGCTTQLYSSIYDNTLSESSYQTVGEMNLNLYESHFSLITNMEAYAMKYRCQTCERTFEKRSHLNRHSSNCQNRVKYKFPGGIFNPNLSIFEDIERQLGITVEKELQYFPWFTAFDFECILEKIDHSNITENGDEEADTESETENSILNEYNSSDSFIDDRDNIPYMQILDNEIEKENSPHHIPAPYFDIDSEFQNESDFSFEDEVYTDREDLNNTLNEFMDHSALDSDLDTESTVEDINYSDNDNSGYENEGLESPVSFCARQPANLKTHTLKTSYPDASSTIYTTRHIPVCVGIASNVPGYNEKSKVFISEDPDKLVKDMLDYLTEIQSKTYKLALERWRALHDKLKGMLGEFSDFKPDSDSECEEETDSFECHPDLSTVRSKHSNCVAKLLKRLDEYMNKLPCLSFNGANYDLPAIKKYFPKHLELASDKKSFVIKKGNSYIAISNEKFIILDIARYMAVGYGYDNFLKSYGAGESKGIFPYEFMNSVARLDHPELPAYNEYYSSLKGCNLLEVEHSTWVKNGKQGPEPKTGIENYQDLKTRWETGGWKTMRDYLSFYVSGDTFPFVQAAENMRDYYLKLNLDPFKMCYSSAGIARRLLFEHARKNKSYFSSFSEDQADLYYRLKASCCGGPSIIFHRYAKVGDPIRDEKDVTIQNILSYDSNSLYSLAMGRELPVMFPIRRREENGYKPDMSAFRHVEQFQWLEYMAHELGVPIKHKLNMGCEVSIPPFFVDGYAELPDSTKLVLEAYGCRYHGHDLNHCLFNRNKQTGQLLVTPQEEEQFTINARKRTLERSKYLESKGYRVLSIYECEFQRLKRNDPSIESHSNYLFPDFYLKQKTDKCLGRKLVQADILRAVEDGEIKGLLEVDLRVPEVWPENKVRDESPYEYFSEMAPIFSNTTLSFNAYSKIMQQHSLSKQSGDLIESRRLLVGGMSATKIFIASNLLQWYLKKGIEVTRIYEVVEYKFEKCFEGFCDLMSNERRRADDSNDELLAQTSKIIANSAYGSLLMDKTKHTTVKYVYHAHDAHLQVNSPLFKKLCELPGGLYEIEKSKSHITIDYPTQLAFCILQTAKLTVLQWWYDTVLNWVNKLDVKLLSMDTDNTIIALSGSSLEESIHDGEKLKEFRDSIGEKQCYDYDENGQPFRARPGFFIPRRCCKKHIKWDKRERGLFKIENTGIEFIGLTSKTYYLHKGENSPDCIKAKGVNKRNLPPDPCVRNMYKNALFGKESTYVTNIGFRLHENNIQTYNQRKCGFTYFYVKRLVADNGIDTFPLEDTLCPYTDHNVYVLCAKRDCLSNDYPFKIFRNGREYKNCTDLYLYECVLFNAGNEKAIQLTKCKSTAGVKRLLKSISVKQEWYTFRYELIRGIITEKITRLRSKIIKNLNETRGKLIVHPGHAANNFLTCGLSKAMAEISDPLEFPGEDYMSRFWEEKLANKDFMLL